MMEPERYELQSGPTYDFALDRREFFARLGGGLFVLVLLGEAEAQESGGGRRRGSGRALPEDVGGWLHIAENGNVSVYTGKAEVGQNIRTSLAQAVAEELRIPVASVAMVMADTDLTPWDAGTFGSLTTPTMAPKLRAAAATAREALIGLAAKSWSVDPATLDAQDGMVVSKQAARRARYGELTKGQKLVETISDAKLTPATKWKIAGHPLNKVNGRSFVTGEHKYATDIVRPGMLFGRVLRPSAFGAKLESFDPSTAQAMKGVTVVREGDFAGVAAPDPRSARRALEVLRAKWNAEPQPKSSELFEYLKANVTDSRSIVNRGSVEQAHADAPVKLRETYHVAYIAHTPLEPRAAVAEWSGGRLTVWTGTQRPFGVRAELAEAFHIPEERIRVIVPDTGSGYGGKHTGEAAIEAARIAKEAGRPVKLVWTREEEFTWAYARPAGVFEIASGATKSGEITSWEFHNYNSGTAGIETVYTIPNQKIEFHVTKSPLRQGSYRALASTANHFARESHIDELAHAAGIDAVEFRLKNLKDDRLRAVLTAVAKKTSPKSGIGCGFEKRGYVASAVDVAVEAGQVKVTRVVTAFECGAIVNPNGLKNQVEGAIIMGLGGALFESLNFDNGVITNPRLSMYRVPRFSDVPELETILIDRKDLQAVGAGECPIVGLAPAIANAIFKVTGTRLRSMPMVPNGLRT
jgi:CO/xanthine dehydrogenase Mo-binding subunit